MSLLTLPIMIGFYKWACHIKEDLNAYNIPNPPKDVRHWRSWATSLILNNDAFYQIPYPMKSVYKKDEDWQKWAEQFVNIVYNIK